MSVRVFFILLIVSLVGGVIFSIYQHNYGNGMTPHYPCYSIIKNGNFVDDHQQPYIFNGGLTWWPHQGKLSVFGVIKESQGSRVINRTLNLQSINQHKDTIHARVAGVDIAAGDQMGKDFTLISAPETPLTLIFKPLAERKWLIMINDNWIAMCEKK